MFPGRVFLQKRPCGKADRRTDINRRAEADNPGNTASSGSRSRFCPVCQCSGGDSAELDPVHHIWRYHVQDHFRKKSFYDDLLDGDHCSDSRGNDLPLVGLSETSGSLFCSGFCCDLGSIFRDLSRKHPAGCYAFILGALFAWFLEMGGNKWVSVSCI